MNQNSERRSLDDVLNAYAISDPGPGYASLVEWIRRYPYYEQELTEFTANWALMKWLPTPAATQQTDEDALVNRGMGIVQNILKAQVSEKIGLLKGIVQEGSQLGLSIQQIARRAQMSMALVRKLDLRRIQFSTIPSQAIEALAYAIQRRSSAVADYLQGASTLPRGASYRAEQAPVPTEPEDFFEAVRSDMTMSQELREHWLSFTSPDAC
jgi:hypothetical protein